ncbi:hypothetical protein GTO36_09715 [bacterium]|nr:hypothetical protein [bacterium]
MDLERGVKRNPNIAWRRETKGGTADGVLLFNYNTRMVHFIEGLGKEIWEECDGRTAEKLLEKLGPGPDSRLLLDFLLDLEERGLVIFE